jgi:hypothetical protein
LSVTIIMLWIYVIFFIHTRHVLAVRKYRACTIYGETSFDGFVCEINCVCYWLEFYCSDILCVSRTGITGCVRWMAMARVRLLAGAGLNAIQWVPVVWFLRHDAKLHMQQNLILLRSANNTDWMKLMLSFYCKRFSFSVIHTHRRTCGCYYSLVFRGSRV